MKGLETLIEIELIDDKLFDESIVLLSSLFSIKSLEYSKSIVPLISMAPTQDKFWTRSIIFYDFADKPPWFESEKKSFQKILWLLIFTHQRKDLPQYRYKVILSP